MAPVSKGLSSSSVGRQRLYWHMYYGTLIQQPVPFETKMNISLLRNVLYHLLLHIAALANHIHIATVICDSVNWPYSPIAFLAVYGIIYSRVHNSTMQPVLVGVPLPALADSDCGLNHCTVCEVRQPVVRTVPCKFIPQLHC